MKSMKTRSNSVSFDALDAVEMNRRRMCEGVQVDSLHLSDVTANYARAFAAKAQRHLTSRRSDEVERNSTAGARPAEKSNHQTQTETQPLSEATQKYRNICRICNDDSSRAVALLHSSSCKKKGGAGFN